MKEERSVIDYNLTNNLLFQSNKVYIYYHMNLPNIYTEYMNFYLIGGRYGAFNTPAVWSKGSGKYTTFSSLNICYKMYISFFL